MRPRRRISLGFYLLSFFCGGLIAILVGYLFRDLSYDFMQHDSDAAYFFEIASTRDFDIHLNVASILSNENSLPILVYSWIYEVVTMLGGQARPIWGILLNALLVVSSQLMALLYARRVFGLAQKELMGLTAMLSLNGLLMMFAGIHMRDAFLLSTTTISVIVFSPRTHATARTVLRNFSVLLLLMGLSFLSRVEGAFVPLTIYLIAQVVKSLNGSGRAKLVGVTLALGTILFLFLSGALELVFDNYTAYKLLSEKESSESSIGHYLLYNLPFPISTLASAALVLFIKFPFWRGMMYDSYSFYMSLAAVQMLIVAPAYIVIVLSSFFRHTDIHLRYLVLVLLSLLLMVALTSNQVRHFAVGYPFLLLLYQMRRSIYGASRVLVHMQHFIFGMALLLTFAIGFK